MPKHERGFCITGCGKPLKQNAKRFCSLQCVQDYNFKLRVSVFLAGEYPPVTNNAYFMRKVLVRLLGEKCSRCGWCERHPITGNVPVEVEHIDGNWRNNSPENLTLLCPNCHSLTATFRALNRGRGRAKRLGGRGGEKEAKLDQAGAMALQARLLRAAELEMTKVDCVDDVQLPLLVADVAERLKAHDL